MKRKDQLLILLIFLISSTQSKIISPPNSLDDYEVIDLIENQNIKGLEFIEMDIDSDSYEKKINKGPIYLNHGIIYNIIDPVSVEFKLDIKTFKTAYINSRNKLEKPINFQVYTNFKDNIKSYELIIYNSRDGYMVNPYAVVKGENLNLEKGIEWNGDLTKGNVLSTEEELTYVIRVYGETGEFNETKERNIKLERNIFSKIRNKEDEKNLKNDILGANNIKTENIVTLGSEVKFYGRDISRGTEIKINNEIIEVDNKGSFVYEFISNKEKEIYTVEVLNGDERNTYSMEVTNPKDYEYLVGLVDFVYGKHNISGNDAMLRNNPDFQASYYNTGRLAAYYKRIKGKYEITAQVDTWSKEIKHMFSDFHERDSDSIFRKIDKDYFRFNYGDDSEIYSDVDSQGKIYLRVDWDKSQVLWGNYNTGFDKGRYTQYNRSLYGGRGEYNSIKTNVFGESKNQLSIFVSNPDTSYKRDRFLGTGGSVYYLSERDIVIGSAKLTIEIRDRATGRLITREVLTEGNDYIINELTGRIILNSPLAQRSFINASEDIIKDNPSSSYNSYLITDYEYYSTGNDISNLVTGMRGKTWMSNYFAVGGTYIKEDREDKISDYELKSGEITLKKSDGTYLKGELSETKGNQLTKDSNWSSYNGGVDFIQQPLIEENLGGRAYYIEGQLVFNDYFKNVNHQDHMKFWYSDKEKGFSTASEASGIEKNEFGLKINHQRTENLSLYIESGYYKEESFDELDIQDGYKEEKKISLGGDYKMDEKLKVALEGEYLEAKDDNSDLITLNNDSLDNGKALLLGTKVSYQVNEKIEGYIKLQSSIWRKEGYGANNLVTVGSNIRITEKLETEFGYSTGNRGDGAEVNLTYQYSPDYEVYTGYHFQNEANLDTNLTLGQKFSYNDSTNLYQESSLVDNNSEKGLLQAFGVDYSYNRNWTMGVLYQMGDVEIAEGDIERYTVASSLRYESRKFFSKHKLEYGKDSGARDSDSWGTINKAKWIPTKEYIFFGEANYIVTEGDLLTLKRDLNGDEYGSQIKTDHKYYELGLGFAYRPIFNDRLNIVNQWNYLYDVVGSGAINSTTSFSEKAHIFSVEAIYDLSQRINIAGKYAIRKDEVRLNSGEDWFDNTLNLYVIRLNYEIIYQWDLFAEYHWLENRGDNEVKQGAMIGIYRDITEYLQIGAGYNFSDFTDDLTDIDYVDGVVDLDYKSEGWFINFIGKF